MLPLPVISKILSKVHMESSPVTNKDYQIIANDMQDSIGESLGVNTLKRLFGSLNENVTPSKSTLNVVARYLDFPDWDSCESAVHDGIVRVVEDETQGEGYCEYILSDYLYTGDRVEFRYDPDNRLMLEYLSNDQFRVLFSSREEFRMGDTMIIRYFQEGCSVIAFNVVRSGQPMPSPVKIACSGKGISYLKCIRKG